MYYVQSFLCVCVLNKEKQYLNNMLIHMFSDPGNPQTTDFVVIFRTLWVGRPPRYRNLSAEALKKFISFK